MTEIRGHNVLPRALKKSFLRTKLCGNAIPDRNEEISPFIFFNKSIKKSSYIKEEKNEKSLGKNDDLLLQSILSKGCVNAPFI